jgi:hypothetical protein
LASLQKVERVPVVGSDGKRMEVVDFEKVGESSFT